MRFRTEQRETETVRIWGISKKCICHHVNNKINHSHKSDQSIQYQDALSLFPVIRRSALTPWDKTIPLIMVHAAELALRLTPFVNTSYFRIFFHDRIAMLNNHNSGLVVKIPKWFQSSTI